MKAAVLESEKNIIIKDVPVPELQEGQIEIKVSAVGVCGSDVHLWKQGKGWNPNHQNDFIMGHEFCGVVTKTKSDKFEIGDRATFWANLYCGECDMCRQGLEHLCREVNGTNYIGFVCNGAYSEYFVGDSKRAYKLPDNVSDIQAALIDPLMVAYHAVRKSEIKLNQKVLVIGAGIIGQMMAHLVKQAGATYIATTFVNDLKIQKAKEIGDFDEYFDGRNTDIAEQLKNRTNGGFDIVFEAVGLDSTLDLAINSVKPGGKVVVIGNSITPTVQFNMNKLVLNEVQLIGSVSCTRVEFEETIDLISKGVINPENYVTDILPLDKLQTAFERLIDENDPALKMVVKP